MSARPGRRARLLLAAAALGLAIPQGVQAAGGPPLPPPRPRLPGPAIALYPRLAVADATTRRANTELAVRLTNASSRSLSVSLTDFTLSAEGDVFGVRRWSAGTAPVRIEPRRSDTIRLSFTIPQSAVSQAALTYRPSGQSIARVLPLMSRRGFLAHESISTFSLHGRAGNPWGLAVDKHGDVWFAAPGCDFEPTCGPGTPPGAIGELRARSHRMVFYRLPNISGNQPIFLAFDSRGNLWFTTPDNSRIGEFSPSRGRFVGQWSVTPGSGPWDLTFSRGTIWYTEHLVAAVGSFSPQSHRHRDFPTPSANSNPYGIATRRGLVWFTENNSTVDRVAVLNTRERNDPISEYPIVRPLSGTPHMIAIGPNGHPWWTEGFSNTLATINPSSAQPGTCNTTGSGTCPGIERFPLPPSLGCAAYGSHVSGIAIERRNGLVWLDDALSAQVGFFSPRTDTFELDTLSGCNDHPHDGLALDAHNELWFGEEFGDAIGEWRG